MALDRTRGRYRDVADVQIIEAESGCDARLRRHRNADTQILRGSARQQPERRPSSSSLGSCRRTALVPQQSSKPRVG